MKGLLERVIYLCFTYQYYIQLVVDYGRYGIKLLNKVHLNLVFFLWFLVLLVSLVISLLELSKLGTTESYLNGYLHSPLFASYLDVLFTLSFV